MISPEILRNSKDFIEKKQILQIRVWQKLIEHPLRPDKLHESWESYQWRDFVELAS